ncbi:MAG: DNA internalization-related competence protein ComEC/Rec2 [Deltaproteobacteria bacterium]|nr:DNA internalization-related competence protein ComEC/Rec2 [Deltaproteobacteria bacterium]MCB9787415.1 DNA internalization-related competence protein ComEC/Rec2 [Deltaproteobacteria bacterium]
MKFLLLLIGCVIGAAAPASVAVASLAAASLVALSRRVDPALGRLAASAAALVAGVAWASLTAVPPAPYGSPEGVVEVSGTVDERVCEAGDSCRVRLVEVSLGPVAIEERLWVRGHSDLGQALHAGDRCTITASVTGARADSNPGTAPPWAARRWRLSGTVWLGAVPRVLPGGASLRARLRAKLREALTLPGAEVTALYRALLLGERGGLSPELRLAFVDSGTAHLLAISGLHLAVVGLGLYRLFLALLLRWRRLAQAGRPPAVAAALAGTLTLGYVAVIAPSQATLRAAVALAVVFAGAVLARRARPLPTLAVAAGALVLADPRAPGGASFQLSFAAATALVLLARHLRPLLARLDEPGALPAPGWRRPARWALALVAVSLVSTAVTTPLALGWFGQASLVAPLCNLVAVPLMSLLVVPVGFAWWIVALIAPPLAQVLAPLPTVAAGWLLDLVEGWAELAGPSTHAAWPHLAGVAASLALLLLLAGRRFRPAAALAAGVALAIGLAARPPAAELRLTALDVGHGDALLVELPEGPVLVVDTGGHHRSGADARLATRTLVPALTRLGIARIDLLVITHADHDHVGAAAALADRVPIGALWLPPCDASGPSTLAVAARVAAQGGQVRQVHRAPALSWGGARLEILWPPADAAGPRGRCTLSRNDDALVLSLRYAGRHLLLTADVEGAAEAALVAREGARLRADVLKVGHHGSRTSSSEAFLDVVRPEVAITSGRRTRTAMPPHLAVLQRYARRHIPLWLTDRDGATRVVVGADGALRVDSRLGRSYRAGARRGVSPARASLTPLRPP